MSNEHPISFVESLLSDHRITGEVQMSTYRYHPRALWDDRTIYSIPVGQLRFRYETLASGLGEDEDIAFHSLVMTPNGKKHFPLVDFNIPERERVEETAAFLVTEYRAPSAVLVHSGRSYHLYLGLLIPESEWVKFMGRILLLNGRNEPFPVDSRWVGHRLMEGYAALRWSARVSPCTPSIVREW